MSISTALILIFSSSTLLMFRMTNEYSNASARILWASDLVFPDMPIEYNSGNTGRFYVSARGISCLPDERNSIYDMLYSIKEPSAVAAPEFMDAVLAGQFCQRYNIPLISIRKTEKNHGELGRLIVPKTFDKRTPITIFTDIINYGKSAKESIEVLRDAGFNASDCLTIMRYGHDDIDGDVSYLTDLKTVLDVGVEMGEITKEYADKCLIELGI